MALSERAQRTTQLLRSLVAGEPVPADDLIGCIYDELRGLAQALLRDQRNATLQPTELIHEAYVRLVAGDVNDFESRRHFHRVAARAMRYVLVDHARARIADKRGGGNAKVTLDEALVASRDDADSVIAVNEGLEALAKVDDQLARLLELRFFGGLTMDEVADTLEISRRSAQRSWRTARAWWLDRYAEGVDDE